MQHARLTLALVLCGLVGAAAAAHAHVLTGTSNWQLATLLQDDQVGCAVLARTRTRSLSATLQFLVLHDAGGAQGRRGARRQQSLCAVGQRPTQRAVWRVHLDTGERVHAMLARAQQRAF
jgi:hypothetical protein